MNVGSVENSLIQQYRDFQQDGVKPEKLQSASQDEIAKLQEDKQQNVQSSFGYEALNKSIENDPIAQFISYLA